MTLTNYWWLLIWLFVGGGFLAYVFPKKKELVLGKRKDRWGIIPAFILALPYIVWAGYRADSFGDSSVYRSTFLSRPSELSELSSYLAEVSKDKGFAVFSIVFKAIFGDAEVLFFIIIAAFQMICVILVFRKYSSNYWISMFLFIASTDYLSWMHNGMRQFIAVAGIFACFGLIVKKKFVPVIVVILLLSTIHGSALIMIPIIFIIQGKFLNRKTVLFMIAGGIAVLFIDQFTSVLDTLLEETQYSELITSEIWSSDDGANILRVLVYSVPAILSLIGKKYIDEANDPVICICCNASFCTFILYCLAWASSGILVGRLPIYTTLMGYMALPWLIDNIFTRKSAGIIKTCMIFGYLLYFYFQTHFIWGIL